MPRPRLSPALFWSSRPGDCSLCGGAGEQGPERTAKPRRASFCGDGNAPMLIVVVTVTQLCEWTGNLAVVHLKGVNCVCELHHSKTVESPRESSCLDDS